MGTQLTTQPNDVYRAICQVAKEISRDGIAKNKANEQQHYKFRGIDDIYNALSAVIAGADLCILPRMAERTQEERATAKGGVLFYVTVRADFDFVSARDGSKHTVTMYGEAMDSADKATNKAMSAAYKYACLQVFCIPTEGMDDADSQTPEPAPRPNSEPIGKPIDTSQPWLKDFRLMVDAIGEAAYLRIMGTNGYKGAREILDSKTAHKVLAEMRQEREDQARSIA